MSKSVASWHAYMAEIGVIAAAAAFALLPARPAWIETGYSTTVYPRLERVLTPLSNHLPFALLDPLLVLVIGGTLILLARVIRQAWRTRTIGDLGRTVLRLVAGAAVLYIVFLLLWGFNYRRVPMRDRLVIDRAAPTTE